MAFHLDGRVVVITDVDGPNPVQVAGVITKSERVNKDTVKYTFLDEQTGQEGWIYDNQPVS